MIRWIVKVLLIVAVVAAAAGVFLYVQAGRLPEGYRPEQMTHEQSEIAANDFINRKIFGEFGNQTQTNEPFDWVLTEQQANQALASMDEMAFQLGARAGQVKAAMDRLGLSQPAVRFLDNKIVLMARFKPYDRALTAELLVQSLPDGRASLHLGQVRIGRLPVPASLVREQVAALVGALSPPQSTSRSERAFGTFRSQDAAEVMGQLLRQINGPPTRGQLQWPINRKKVQIEAVELVDGQVTLHFQPVRRPAARLPGK